MKWKDVTLYKFQQIEIKNSQDIEEIDKTLFAVCYLFGFTEYELDQKKLNEVDKYVNKVKQLFSSEMKINAPKRIGRYMIEYNPERLTFGQYVELSYFFTMPQIQAAHYVLASISRLPFLKNRSDKHKIRAEYFQKQPVTKTLGALKIFTEQFADFNKRFSALFIESEEKETKTDPFNQRYGWTYSASCVAEYERISLEQAYALPAIQALNDLVFLKEKQSYEEKILTHARKKIIAAKLTVDTGNAAANVKNVGDELKSVKGNLDSAGTSAQKTGKNISDTGGHFSNLKGQLNGLPGPLKGVTEGTSLFNNALNVLRANPIIAILTVLGLIIAALFNKFKQMEGVSDSLGKAFGALSGLLNTFINKILTPLIEGFTKVVEVITDAATWIADIFSPGLGEAAKRSGELAEALDDLNDAEADSAIARAESNRLLQEARDLANDANIPIKDRIASLKEAGKIEKEELDKSIDIATQRAKIMLEQIAIELDAREDLIQSIRNGSLEQLKAARSEIMAMENVDKEKLRAIDALIIRAEDEGAQRAKINKKTEQGISALEKEEENKREEERKKAHEANLKAIQQRKQEEDRLYQFRSKLRQLQQENELSTVKDGYEKEIKALTDKINAEKAANEKSVKDGKLRRSEANLLNAELDKQFTIKSAQIKEKADKETADKERAFQDKLNKIKQEAMLGGIVDLRQLEKEQLKISYQEQLKQAEIEYANNADQLAQIKAAIDEKYRVEKQKQDEKFAAEDAKKKLEEDKKKLEANLNEQGQIINDPMAEVDAKKAALDIEQQLIQAAFDQKILTEQEYNEKVKALADARVAVAEYEHNYKKQQADETAGLLGKLSDIVGKQTAAGKALAVAQAVINMWTGVSEALKQKSTLPSPFDYAAKAINVAATIATGTMAIKKILAVQVPGGGGGGSAAASGGSIAAAAPLSPQSQSTKIDASSINDFANAAKQQPVKAYVVESESGDTRQRLSRLARAARLGG